MDHDDFFYLGMPDGMEDIKEQYEKAAEECRRLRTLLDTAREEQLRKKALDIQEQIPFYTKKLEKLKAYADAFLDECRGRHVEFGFRKVDPSFDDYHAPTHDPLNWRLCEYDLLEMSQHLEIVFDYSNGALREFVCDWMKKNMDYAREDGNLGNGYFWKE